MPPKRATPRIWHSEKICNMKFSLQERFDDSSQLGERLFRQAVRSGVWLFALRIIEQGFNLIRLVILARILVPHDFGLFGIALLAMMTLETFSQTGFERALIQKKESIYALLKLIYTSKYFAKSSSVSLFLISLSLPSRSIKTSAGLRRQL